MRHQHETRHQIAGFDEVITTADADYATSGVRTESLIRLGFLGTLAGNKIAGSLGSVTAERLQRLRQNLARHLQDKLPSQNP